MQRLQCSTVYIAEFPYRIVSYKGWMKNLDFTINMVKSRKFGTVDTLTRQNDA